MSRPRIRVVVAGECALDRHALAAFLMQHPGVHVLGLAADPAATLHDCRTLHPDVLLLDAGLGPHGDVPLVTAVHSAAPEVRMLCLARLVDPAEDETLILALARGAQGAVYRSVRPEIFLAALQAVAAGQSWVDPGLALRLARGAVGGLDAGEGPLVAPWLTRREVEVAALITEGCSNKEIARSLSVGEPTVKKHVGHLLAKMQVGDRLQLGLRLSHHPEFLAAGARQLVRRSNRARVPLVP